MRINVGSVAMSRDSRSPLRDIHEHCIECMGGNVREVKNCTSPKCKLYPYRFGKNPFRKGKPSSGEGLKKWREEQKKNETL